MRKKRQGKFKLFNFKTKPKLNHKVIWGVSFFILISIILVGLGYAIYVAGIFKVREDSIKSNIVLSKSLKESIKNKSLFDLDIKAISRRILKGHPEYKEVYVSKRFPSTVIVEVKKRIPFAQIKGKKFYPIDREAVILSDGSIEPLDNLVSIEISDYNRFLKKGTNIEDERLEYAFNLLETLAKDDFFDEFIVRLINSTHLQASYFIMEHKDSATGTQLPIRGIKIRIGQDDFRQKVKLLKRVIKQELKDKISLVKYIDLRHKKVYIGFKR